jgi:hypothetical protein
MVMAKNDQKNSTIVFTGRTGQNRPVFLVKLTLVA